MNILHEGDWRAFPHCCYALEEYYAENNWAWEVPEHERCNLNEDHPLHPRHWSLNEGHPDGLPRILPNWMRLHTNARGNLENSANNWFRNLHCICTAAHRWRPTTRPNGSGDVIAFGWKRGCRGVRAHGGDNGTPSNLDKPARWNGMWGITTRAARIMLEEYNRCKAIWVNTFALGASGPKITSFPLCKTCSISKSFCP